MAEKETLVKKLKDYVGYKSGRLIIIGDDTTKDIAQMLESVCLEGNGNVYYHHLNEKDRPITEVPEDILTHIKEFDRMNPDENVLLLMIRADAKEVPFKNKLIELIEPVGKVGGLNGLTMEVLEAAYHPLNDSATKLVDELYEKIRQEKSLRIMSERGTDITVEFDYGNTEWIKSDGKLEAHRYSNPIPAELYNYPFNANGKIVIDGVLGELRGEEPYKSNPKLMLSDLEKTPVTWIVKNNVIVDIQCENQTLLAIAKKYTFGIENGAKLCEVGLPANRYVMENGFIGVLAIDEKGGIHVAHGNPYEKNFKDGKRPHLSNIHSDGIIRRGTLVGLTTGTVYMKDGLYNSSVFQSLCK